MDATRSAASDRPFWVSEMSGGACNLKGFAKTPPPSPKDYETWNWLAASYGAKATLMVNRAGYWIFPNDAKQPMVEEKSKDMAEMNVPHWQNWMDCIKTRQKPVCDIETGARSVTVCHLVNLAYWNHRKLRWDPQKWEFPGDAEANKWRTRDRRKGYELPAV